MHLWRQLIASGLFASFAAGAAVVYKWTDAEGVVHFSDQPVPGAEKIITSGAASNGINSGVASGPATMPQPRNAQSQAVAAMAIESPAKEQVFFNDDVVPVRLHVEPGLQPSQTIAWNLNGQPLSDQGPKALSFGLSGLARGTYTLGATVTDSSTGASQSADSVTFYVRQPSELAPQHKKS
jgi:hypothetical protein